MVKHLEALIIFGYSFHWEALAKYAPYFIPAAVMTFKITAAGILIGLMLGLLTAFCKISHKPFLNVPAKLYIFLVRGTPLLIQLLIIYVGLVNIIYLDPFPAAALALGIHNGAYLAEIFRGAIQSIDRGQMEAARSLGMPYSRAMRRIILPQAFKRAIPPLGNQFIIALKDSSLASVISISELVLKARQLAASTYMQMEMLLIAAVYYLLFTSLLTVVVNYVEKRMQISDGR